MNTLTEKINKQIAAYNVRIQMIDSQLNAVKELIHADRDDVSALTERSKLNAQRQLCIQFISELEELLLLA